MEGGGIGLVHYVCVSSVEPNLSVFNLLHNTYAAPLMDLG